MKERRREKEVGREQKGNERDGEVPARRAALFARETGLLRAEEEPKARPLSLAVFGGARSHVSSARLLPTARATTLRGGHKGRGS